ncbi:MAG TPA: RNA polymerase sigma factor RpoD [Cyanobacteria bacterium UBA10660]|nr:MAG TPA: RNA polymerase sigma factor RpoD [Candidatus Gastranaerophilales bacterium HUM_1]HAS94346.1 RNA polymerase sigma factor RpoD [Cyanobacteria bacterium UBA10660]
MFMRRDELIVMKVTTQNSNPAKKEVVEGQNDNTLTAYLREIADYPQLTAEEEKIVAEKIEQGDSEAKQKLIQANLKLVVTIAKKTIHMSGVPMIDLIQEGNLGLMIAAEKFNHKLGYRFSTYASWWIKQSMFKAISEQSHCMKIPVYIQETLSKFSKVKYQMEQNTTSQVKNEEVAKKMNIAPDKIEMFLSAYTKTISIENGLEKSDGKDLNVADILADNSSLISENAEYQSLKDDIKNVISTLKEREQEVVKMRYGLDDTERYTLEEIGNIYGVTKECIRQTELRALKKMKMTGENLLSCYIY